MFVESENAVSIQKSEASAHGESHVFPEANEAGEVKGRDPIAVPSTPKGMVSPKGMVMPVGNKEDSQGPKSMYLLKPGEELGPLWVQPRAERCVTGCLAHHRSAALHGCSWESPVY